MAQKTRKSGRTRGASAFSQAEDDIIRRAIQTGKPLSTVAALLKRSRSGVYARAQRVAGQLVIDLGQGDDIAAR